MTELTETTFKTKSKISPAAFEVPKFEVPNFELPKIEIPRAFRELVEKSVSQVKETCDNLKCAADEASDLLEKTYATTTKGTSDYGLKVIEVTRENTRSGRPGLRRKFGAAGRQCHWVSRVGIRLRREMARTA
jgi:hypothetical protein